eukprot:956218-Pleurochrysis_carterae.AAC.1
MDRTDARACSRAHARSPASVARRAHMRAYARVSLSRQVRGLLAPLLRNLDDRAADVRAASFHALEALLHA